MSKITNDGLTRSYSCTYMATVGVRGLSTTTCLATVSKHSQNTTWRKPPNKVLVQQSALWVVNDISAHQRPFQCH